MSKRQWARRLRVASIVVVCGASCGDWSVAFAEDYAGVSDDSPAPNPDEARARYRAGASAYAEGRYKDAIDLFLEANQLEPSAALSYNVARAYEKLGDTAGALSFYRDYLRRAGNPEDKDRVQRIIEGLCERLEKRGIQQVTILSSPHGATLSIDGKPVGVTPWTFELRPGNHHLSLSLRGYDDVERDFRLWPEVARDVTVRLTEAASATPKTPASGDADPRAAALDATKSNVQEASSAGAAAVTSANGTSDTDGPRASAPASSATTSLAKTEEPTADDAPAREPAKDAPQTNPTPHGGGAGKALTTWGIVALSAGGAALGGALTFELLRRGSQSDAEHAKTQTAYADSYDAMTSQQTAARVLVGTGAALAITGGTLLYFGLRTKHRTPTTAWSFGCDGHGCSGSVQGRF